MNASKLKEELLTCNVWTNLRILEGNFGWALIELERMIKKIEDFLTPKEENDNGAV